jgi:hypothetical protein
MKTHRPFALLCALIAVVSCSLSEVVWSGSLFCPKTYIDGYEQELKVGHKLFVTEVQVPEKASFYVTHGFSRDTQNSVYIQSNFRPVGADYAFKVMSDETADVPTLLYFLLEQKTLAEAPEEDEKAFMELLPKFEIILDGRIFDAAGNPTVELGSARNLKYLPSSNQAPKPILTILKDDTLDFYIENEGNMFLPIKSGKGLQETVNTLKARQFSGKNSCICNLIGNSKVKETVASFPLESAKNGAMDSPEDLLNIIDQHKGGTVLLVSHVNEDTIPVQSSRGVEFNISVKEIDTYALQHDCTLIHFGCGSSEGGSSIGVKEPQVATLAILNALNSDVKTWNSTWDILSSVSRTPYHTVVSNNVQASVPSFQLYADADESKDQESEYDTDAQLGAGKLNRVADVRVIMGNNGLNASR